MASAQLSFEINILAPASQLSPVPYRDGIPQALIKTIPQKNQIITINPTQIVKENNTSNSASVAHSKPPVESRISLPKPIIEKFATPNTVALKIYPSPPLIKTLPVAKLSPTEKAKIVYNLKKELPVPTLMPLEKIPIIQLKQDQVNLSELIKISNDEYKMIEALIVYEYQKKLDFAFSLFADLQSSSQFKEQAQYYYAELAYALGLNAEFRFKMIELLKNSQDISIKKEALTSLVKNANALDTQDVAFIENEISRLQIKQASEAYIIKKSKYQIKNGQLNSTIVPLESISINSKNAPEAKLLLSTAFYRLGDLNNSIKQLELVKPKMSNDRTDKIRNLTFLTLARLYFQKGDYKKSYSHYLLIDKTSQFWLQSTTEQAITQIMAKDYLGAAGNMFSIHTEYFRKAYSPESYLIRSIGYLNLCQYGDSVSVVSELQKRYTPLLETVSSFELNHKNSNDYYQLFRDIFKNNDQSVVSGINKSFIVEIARHPSFMSIQKMINKYEEEIEHFGQIAKNLTNKTAQIRQEISQIQNNINILKTNKMNVLQIEQMSQKIIILESDLNIAKSGRDKIEKMKLLAESRIANEKIKLKKVAGEVLQKRFTVSKSELASILDQKDVLVYEIYSGAGEHIRYQMAGGETKERSPANSLTPEEMKSYKWKFRGEVWEDEIGHYRSSLTNVCPKDVAHNKGE